MILKNARVDWQRNPRVGRDRINKLTRRASVLGHAVAERDEAYTSRTANAAQRQRNSSSESAWTDARRERNDAALTLDLSKGDFARLERERDSLRDQLRADRTEVAQRVAGLDAEMTAKQDDLRADVNARVAVLEWRLGWVRRNADQRRRRTMRSVLGAVIYLRFRLGQGKVAQRCTRPECAGRDVVCDSDEGGGTGESRIGAATGLGPGARHRPACGGSGCRGSPGVDCRGGRHHLGWTYR
jgi:hypothetical protein